MLLQSLRKIVKNTREGEFTKLSIMAIVFVASLGFFIGQSYAQTPGTPDPPVGFTAVAISPTSASLSWSPPQNNGGAHITGYKIELRTPSTSYTNIAILGNVTTYTHLNLITGNTYIYRVFAINSNGTGSPSPEVLVKPTSSSVPLKNIAPNPPGNLTATIYSSTQINLSWSHPTSNGSPPVSGYKIQYKFDSGNFTNLVSNSGNSFTAYSHTGLQVAHTYTYRVFAINSIGTSNSSNTATTTTVQITTVPGSPVLSASPSSATSVSLSWTPPTNDGGSAITGYKIEYSNGTSQYIILVANTGNTQTAYLHKGLVTGKVYTYRVTAINSIGAGNPSNIVSAKPQETKTPTITSAIAISPTQVSLSWIPPSQTYGQVINGYRIDQVINGALIFIDNAGIKSTTYTVPNLTTGKTYTFAVTALLSAGSESDHSLFVSVTPTSTSSAPSPSSQPASQNSPPPQNQALPDPPAGLNATMIPQNTVQLTWIMPSNNGKVPITGFKVETKTNSSGIWSLLTANTGIQTSFVKSGLQKGTTYFYRVSSTSSIGTGLPSSEVMVNSSPNTNQTTPTPPITLQQSQGMIPVINTTSTISYQIIGGQILGVSVNPGTFSLNINLKANTAGTVSVQIPRDMIDAKKLDGTDEAYIVTEGKNIAQFNETKTISHRTLAISFPANTSQISIY